MDDESSWMLVTCAIIGELTGLILLAMSIEMPVGVTSVSSS
jgi:hypothetical protein